MRLPRYLLYRPCGFFFRLAVPTHLRRHFGRREIKRSLGTRDPRLACAWASALLLAYHQAIARVEATGMSWGKNDDDELAQALGLTGLRRPQDWKVRHPSGAEVEGPDTADKTADMAAAQEAARFLADLYGGAGPVRSLPPVAPSPAPPQPGPPAGVKAMSTGAAVAQWLAYERTNFTTPARLKTYGKLKNTGEAFAAFVKPSTRLHTIARADCAGFYHHLMMGGMARNTAQSVQSYLTRFFAWASGTYYPEDKANPAAKHIRLTRHDKAAGKGSGYQAFGREQLRKMFTPDNFAALPTLKDRWLVVLALYTGARSNELAGLEVMDVGPTDDGLNVIDINGLGEGKSIKTDASRRKVPIHPDLIALGLFDRLAARRDAGEGRLFPGNLLTQNGPAASSQKAFLSALKAWGIAPRGKGRMGLHSFRATVIQRMTDKGVAQGWRERFVGHENSEAPSTLNTDHTATYGAGGSALAAIASQCLPALNWTDEKIIDVAALRPLLAVGAAPDGPKERDARRGSKRKS